MAISIQTNINEVLKELRSELDTYRRNMRLTVFQALTILEGEILNNIRTKSGLKVRSGSLLNSIGRSKKVEDAPDGSVVGTIGPEGVPYARIHEHGGQTKPHEILPRNSKFLAFAMGGGTVFARRVNHPGSKIPAHPYLAPAVNAKKEEILNTFGILIKNSFDL